MVLPSNTSSVVGKTHLNLPYRLQISYLSCTVMAIENEEWLLLVSRLSIAHPNLLNSIRCPLLNLLQDTSQRITQPSTITNKLLSLSSSWSSVDRRKKKRKILLQCENYLEAHRMKSTKSCKQAITSKRYTLSHNKQLIDSRL